MGIISLSTPCSAISEGKMSSFIVPRWKHVAVDTLTCIAIVPYKMPHISALSKLKMTSIESLRECILKYSPPLSTKLNLVWHAGYHFQDEFGLKPNWSGFVLNVSESSDSFHPVSEIRLLPIIDLNLNDLTSIYSTLLFVERQAKILNMPTACITFDQPLYSKAVEISLSSRMDVVCRLGGFHLLMNFLDAVGYIMQGSGLSEALLNCYGEVTLTHMMTGKAYSKSLRGHYLVESALTSILINHLIVGDPNIDT
jgi:hypothetical protein